MRKTLAEIAKLIDGEVVGDRNLVVTGLRGIQDAREGDVTFITNPKYFPFLKISQATAVVIPRGMKSPRDGVILVKNPSHAFLKLAACFSEEDRPPVFQGVHPKALVAENATLGSGVCVGANAVIENGAVIGDNTVIHAGCFVGYKTVIGNDCLIYPNVVLREKVTLGNKVIVHSSSVIGSDGFGYEEIDHVHQKIPQLGTVIVEDDVEIGSCVTIDRARLDQTLIGRGTKIDNLVHIGHNVVIGEHCIIIAQVGIAGSVTVGKRTILAGQAGIAGHLTIGEGSIVSAQSGVTRSLPALSRVSGYPARPHDQAKRVNAGLQRLPLYIKKIAELEKRIKSLEKKPAKTPARKKK